MVALDEKMDVEFAEHRRKTVDVVEFVPMSAPPYPQAIAEWRIAVGHAGHKEPGRVDAFALGGDLAARRIDNRHALGVGQHRPDIDPGRGLVHPEKRKRVAVSSGDERLDLAARAMRHARP